MPTVEIRGIPVEFPFPPYDIQKNYMEKVIECLETRQNGILESPTGTGKTLCLLCATLAWIEAKKHRSPPIIIYASRTHAQLHQAVQEMRKTAYNYTHACVLGSRKRTCINNVVVTQPNAIRKLALCRSEVEEKSCIFQTNVESKRHQPELCEKNIIDIEDIVELGKKHSFCPYYMSRELKATADIIFIPYNYVLDPRTRKTMDVHIENSIVIFDEGHNIEKVCEESASAQVNSTHIESCIDDVNAIIELEYRDGLDVKVNFSPRQCHQLKEILTMLLEQLDNIKLAETGTVFDGDYIFELLGKAGVNEENAMEIQNLLWKVMVFLTRTKKLARNGYGLDIVSNFLDLVFYRDSPEFRLKMKQCCKVQIQEEDDPGQFSRNRYSQSCQKKSRVLNLWCFSPALGLTMLMDRKIHSIIIASGTLAPLKSLVMELELNVGVQIENPHIVTNDQVCVKILTEGPDAESLNSNFQNKNNPKYIQSLGLVISKLIQVIPNGVLIFFPSYVIMDKCCQDWQKTGIWNVIQQIKPIFREPKNKTSFSDAVNGYYSIINNPNHKGAIFMGVCRGKLSEGLDFADINGRAVFIIGLPFPPLKEPKVVLKRQYLDSRHERDKEYLKGEEWYSLEATRAINQAIGRVIRHKNDYGAIVLLDSRFTDPKIKDNLSLWLRRHITEQKNFEETMRHLNIFFQNAKEHFDSQIVSKREILVRDMSQSPSKRPKH